MRRLVAVLISLSLAFGGLLFTSPAISVGVGILSGGFQGYMDSVRQGHSGSDQINDVIGGAVIGEIASRIGVATAKPLVSFAVSASKNQARSCVKWVAKKFPVATDYIAGKSMELSTSYILGQGNFLLDRRTNGKNRGLW